MNLTAKHDGATVKEPQVLRLQVYLSHGGVASRRAAEKMITQGRVMVNGRCVQTMGEKIFPGDEVYLDGKLIKPETCFHYLVLNKPEGYICSSHDPQGRPLALDLLPPITERLYNVGRLDFLSCGLILFTNDGDFSARLSHPASEIEKEYLVTSTVPIPSKLADDFVRGIHVEGVMYRAKEAEKINNNTIRLLMIEGKNREIRRVFSHYRLHPKKLQRIRIGPVNLGDLKEGESRPLTNNEIKSMEKLW